MVPSLKKYRDQLEDLLIAKSWTLWFLILFCFVYWAGNRTFCFADWTGSGMFVFGSWQGNAVPVTTQVGTLGFQRGNHTGYHYKELPVPRGRNSWFPTWELMRPNMGTIGYHCKELPVPTGWNWWFPTQKPNVTHGKELPASRPWKLGFPTWEPEVTIARNCPSQKLDLIFSKLAAFIVRTAGSQSLKLMVPNLKKNTLHVEGSVDCKKVKNHSS